MIDPFYRIEADRDRAAGGTGLGLAIVKTCMEACHGSVAASNLSPTGLEVRIVLPATAGASRQGSLLADAGRDALLSD